MQIFSHVNVPIVLERYDRIAQLYLITLTSPPLHNYKEVGKYAFGLDPIPSRLGNEKKEEE